MDSNQLTWQISQHYPNAVYFRINTVIPLSQHSFQILPHNPTHYVSVYIYIGVPLATEAGIPLITGWLAGGPLLHGATIRRTTDTFLFISHTTNVLLFKFRIIKEMLGSVASGTHTHTHTHTQEGP